MKDHLSRQQRNAIRYRIRATEQGIARKYGISVAMVRQVRAGAQPNHPARLAAKHRRLAQTAVTIWESKISVTGGGGGGKRSHLRLIPTPQVKPPKGQLHTEGGVDLPQPLG